METMYIIIIMVVIAVLIGSVIIYFNLFKKKKKLPFEFKAAVFIPDVNSMEQQTSIECVLRRDPSDQLLYIVDTATNGTMFKEIYPGENKKTFMLEELPTLKEALTKLETSIKNHNTKSLDNVLDLKKEASRIRIIIKKYNEPEGTFVIKIGGNKVLFYIRKSTGNEVLHFDIHNNIAFSPTERNSRDLFNSWKTKYENLKKDNKAPFEKITQAIAAVVLAILIIVFALLTWNWLQADMKYADSMRTQAYICQQTQINGMDNVITSNQETSNILNDFAKNMLVGQSGTQGPVTDPIK